MSCDPSSGAPLVLLVVVGSLFAWCDDHRPDAAPDHHHSINLRGD